MKRYLPAIFACVALAASVQASDRLPPGAVLVDPDATGLDPVQQRRAIDAILHALERGDADAALARLHAETDPLRFEHAAAAVIDALLQGRAVTHSDRFLSALESAPIRVHVQHPETAADWFLPLYDIPGQAQSARRVLAQAARVDALLARWHSAKSSTLEALAVHSPAEVAAAIERASDDVVQRLQRAALRSPDALHGSAWVALARRTADYGVLRAAHERAAAVELLPLIAEVARGGAVDAAYAWLLSLETDPRYASAAVMGLGMLAPRSPRAEQRLLEHLKHEDTGKSAAAAFASLAVPDRIARLDRALQSAEDPTVLRHLALALRLEGSGAARERLARLADDTRLVESVRKELQR